MATDLLWGVKAPHHNGMVIGDDIEDVNQYAYLAYYNDQERRIVFGCAAGRVILENGEPYHVGLISSVKGRSLPKKGDSEVWAIPEEQYRRLVVLERRWWADHAAYLAIHHRKTSEAARYAHRLA